MRHPFVGAVATALGLVACQNLPAKLGAKPASLARPAAGPSATPLAASPAASPLLAAPDGSPQASPPPRATPSGAVSGLALPLRLGFALPPSLVGLAASQRLDGKSGKVLAVGSVLAVGQDGALVANNSGSLVSNNGSSIVSNNSGGAIAAQQRILFQNEQTDVLRLSSDPRVAVWASLIPIDIVDQVLGAYAKTQPILGRWSSFEFEPDFVPPPQSSPLLDAYLKQVLGPDARWYFTALLRQEGDSLKFWVLRLPKDGARPNEGKILADLSVTKGQWVARLNPPIEVLDFSGASGAAIRLESTSDGGVFTDSGTVMLPCGAQSALAKALALTACRVAERRQTLIRLKELEPSSVHIALSELGQPTELPSAQKVALFVGRYGFAAGLQEDAGLAVSRKFKFDSVGAVLPAEFFATTLQAAASGPDPFDLVNALGDRVASPGEALTRLIPLGGPALARLSPPLPKNGERLDLLPDLAPVLPPQALLALP